MSVALDGTDPATGQEAVNEILVERVMEALAPAMGDQILELYCGAGNFSLSLADRGAEVFGVELDEGKSSMASQQLKNLMGIAVDQLATTPQDHRNLDV